VSARRFRVAVDSPVSRASDWEAYCNADALPATIRSEGADDVLETWIVTARTEREALARARATARRLGVRVIVEA
jgi:hypothetical protein